MQFSKPGIYNHKHVYTHVRIYTGSPSGSTPVESLLQSSWQPTLLERTEEGSQDNTTYAPRPKTYLVAKNRVRLVEIMVVKCNKVVLVDK